MQGNRIAARYLVLVAMSARGLGGLLVLVVLMVAAPSAANADTSASGRPSTASEGISVLAPAAGVVVPELPVVVTIRLPEHLVANSFKASLHGRNLTSRFSLTQSKATASLTLEDGIRVSAGARVPNRLVVSARSSLPGSPKTGYLGSVEFTVKAPEVAAVIAPEGGRVSLPGAGSIAFPAGTFDSATPVQLGVATDPGMANRFAIDTSVFRAQGRLPYELRISAATQPRSDARLTFDVPSSFLAGVPATAEVRAFFLNVWSDEQETLESLELLPERLPRSTKTGAASVSLPAHAFTDGLRTDGTFEAIALLAATPTAPRAPAAPQTAPPPTTGVEQGTMDETRSLALLQLNQQQAGDCAGTTIGPPLAGELVVTSGFGTRNHPVLHQPRHHSGVDLRAARGTPALAVADGIVEVVRTSQTAGYTVVVRHTDGSATQYMHLQQDSALVAGSVVALGDQIALTGDTGRVSGPHLHFAYAPNGEIFQNDAKVNPMPCIGATVAGSITVGDNGNVPDDAFSVAINDRVLCTTLIGATNTCAASNLRPGRATLTITAVFAPDDVGTYRITLRDGLTFSIFAGGGTGRSGVLPQGGSASWEIVIPAPVPPLK